MSAFSHMTHKIEIVLTIHPEDSFFEPLSNILGLNGSTMYPLTTTTWSPDIHGTMSDFSGVIVLHDDLERVVTYDKLEDTFDEILTCMINEKQSVLETQKILLSRMSNITPLQSFLDLHNLVLMGQESENDLVYFWSIFARNRYCGIRSRNTHVYLSNNQIVKAL